MRRPILLALVCAALLFSCRKKKEGVKLGLNYIRFGKNACDHEGQIRTFDLSVKGRGKAYVLYDSVTVISLNYEPTGAMLSNVGVIIPSTTAGAFVADPTRPSELFDEDYLQCFAESEWDDPGGRCDSLGGVITRYDAKGGLVEGSWGGRFEANVDSAGVTVTKRFYASGVFSVIRE